MSDPLPQPAGREFARLPWESRFVDETPGDSEARNFARAVEKIFYSRVEPTPVAAPRLLGWSDRLGAELGILRPGSGDGTSLELLAGNRVLPIMKPYAARYGGHQFGHWAGQLGDGRAITLGEAATAAGRMEFQLKGAGPTPYSRRADGRAVLRSSLREFLCSEAMHFLGVPTTRALSLVATGDQVVRDMFYDGNPEAEPGAIVCRVAPTFLRFGNFQIFANSGEHAELRQLADIVLRDHYPELGGPGPEAYARMLDEIARRTALMIVHWMRVGFVHGVMNTDNMSVLGVTIDYGPYGWLEPFEPGWTPNTTDAQGRRYAYGNQPSIALWNIARLAEAFLPLIDQNIPRAEQTLSLYREVFETSYANMLLAKMGLPAHDVEDQKLFERLYVLLQRAETDYTIFFRSLSDWRTNDLGRVDAAFAEKMLKSFYSPKSLGAELLAEWHQWFTDYSHALAAKNPDDEKRSRAMKRVNPKYVLRNYLAQNAINAATEGDTQPMERLLRVLQTPYDDMPEEEDLAGLRPDWARNTPGCSALSCSS